MSILIGFCLLLVIISMILALNAVTRLERIRLQHDMMQKEFTQMRLEYTQLQERLLAAAVEAATVPPKPGKVAESEAAPPPPSLSPEESLQEQLRIFQTIVEAYRRQHAGRFPGSLETLATFANRQGLQKTIENPYTHARNPLISEDVCIDITYDPADEGMPEYAGRLLFQANFGPRAQVVGYTLAAFDANGMLLKREDGEVLTLTHQG